MLKTKNYKLKTGPKIFVAMSGGVDSSVSAALLKEQGHDVVGVFMKVWSPDWLPCPWPEERRDAMRVAAHLEIPFYTFDFTKEYKQHVVDYMIDEYRRGRVPNPDVMCNKFVKFDAFLKKSLEMGADCIATGHYARVLSNKHEARNPKHEKNSKSLKFSNFQNLDIISDFDIRASNLQYRLLAGVDTAKDQSYFLWTLTQQQLSRTLFPIGHLTKSQVREEARRFGLPVAEKKDSQGVCFLGPIDMKEFLKHYIEEVPGEVVSESGEVLGHHEGVTFYTIGERRGFTITKKTPTDSPYYVIGKDIENNRLVVSHREASVVRHQASEESVIPLKNGPPAGRAGTHVDHSLAQVTQVKPVSVTLPLSDTGLTCVRLEQVSWSRGEAPDPTKAYQARIRYRQPLQPCHLEELPPSGNLEARLPTESLKCVLIFDAPQEAVAAGQSLVLYDGEECLGGGIIV